MASESLEEARFFYFLGHEKDSVDILERTGRSCGRSDYCIWQLPSQHNLACTSRLAYPDSAFPAPGTSKWNKIEHRMFSLITPNWRARPLVSDQTIIDLIASTRTKTGLKFKAKLTPRIHPSGVEISAAEMANAQPEIRSISRRRELLLPAPNDRQFEQVTHVRILRSLEHRLVSDPPYRSSRGDRGAISNRIYDQRRYVLPTRRGHDEFRAPTGRST